MNPSSPQDTQAAHSPAILIVDDTPINVDVMRDLLLLGNYAALAAQTGADAIACARSKRPDLILLDVVMPGMDGYETCRRLKADASTCDIPVIFMSSLAETRDKLAGFEVGGVDYIAKPFQADEVLARVGAHLSLRGVNRRLAVENDALLSETTTTSRRLAATVAHEINNPIAFVFANLGALDRHVSEVSRLMALDAPVDRAARQAELAFLQSDMADLVRESREGLARVAETVRALVHFTASCGASLGWQCVDLHRGLDSTLSMLSCELRQGLSIRKDYDPDAVREIECLPAELNLAFMNLVLCVAHDLAGDGEIRIATGTQADGLWVEIAGSALSSRQHGSPLAAHARPVVGRDSGLLVARAIIDKHRGRIEVVRSPATPSFRVCLPLRQ
ncbi:response regulator [Piscinibacter sp.]|uniref:response regulator n=1 Tax=Piscinibacter sp. TaxID=1903157 RepID=UPI002C1ABD91|nr:response regulator [Albitalea sp.]HUG23712.1 response regulator [Albitalea sp.]